MSTTFLTWGAWLAVAVALGGTLVRVALGFQRYVGAADGRPTAARRLAAATRGALGAVLSRRAPHLVVAFLLDVLLQRRLLLRDPVRWAAHVGLVVGFVGLVLGHAMARVVTQKVFPGYVSTLNPWLWLRELLGVLVLAGLVVGIVRRRQRRGRLPIPTRRDPLFVALLALVVTTGFLLMAAKIVSSRAFDRMLEEYPVASGDEAIPLEAYWADAFGVVFDDLPSPLPSGALEAGEELHVAACADCHAPIGSAFVSYPLSRGLVPLARPLRTLDAEQVGLYLHVVLAFLALAWLPFGRAFHALSVPAGLLAQAGATSRSTAALANRRALALEACVRCGLCDEACSVRPLATALGNRSALPSVKLDGLRRLGGRTPPSPEGLAALAAGAAACTGCARCTRGCPAGLDLTDLWAAGDEALAANGRPAARAWIERHDASEWADLLAAKAAPPPATPGHALPVSTSLTLDRRAFSACVQCQTCTNVCPVVEHSGGECRLDATPQKAMNLLRLGLTDLALGSRIVWDCATCYQCQEACPEGLRVTDILYELRNRAWRDLGALDRTGAGASREGGAA